LAGSLGEPPGAKVVVTVSVSSAAQHEGVSAAPAKLRAEVGDLLVIDQDGAPGPSQIAMIIGVSGADGSPPYVVHWIAGDYESRIVPGAGAHIERRHRHAAP
jgi:hypothetical protein